MAGSARDAGIEALRGGDAQAARTHLEQAVAENPQDAQAHAYLGAAYGQLQMLEQAVESLTHAARIAPSSAPLRYNVAVAQEKAGKREEAVASYRQALALDGSYDRARQALVRLGRNPDATSAVSTPSHFSPHPPAATAPSVAAPPGAAGPAAAPSGLSEFSLGGDSAAASPLDRTLPGPVAPGAGAYGPPPPATTYGSSSGASAAPAAPAASIYGPPTGASLPPPPAPPAPAGGIAGGYVPGGDTTIQDSPRELMTCTRCGKQTIPAMLCGWCSAPLPPPPPKPAASQAPSEALAPDPVIHRATATDGELSKSEFLARSYLAGMTMGLWWGLIGAVFSFLMATATQRMSEFSQLIPVTLTVCAMQVATGALLFGLFGLMGANSEDAESTCANCGLALGVLAAFGGGAFTAHVLVWSGAPIIGSIWLTRIMGRSLGASINELQSSVLVVSGPGSVAVAMRH